MTIYCIIDPTGDVVPGSVSDTPIDAWQRCILVTTKRIIIATWRDDQAAMEADGYRLGRASWVTFERVG